MPLSVLCPGCLIRLTVGEDHAGTSFACPKCGIAISVPIVMAPVLTPVSVDYDSDLLPPSPAPAAPRPPTAPAPEPPAPRHDGGEGEDRYAGDALPRRRRRLRNRRARTRLLLMLAVVTALGIAAFFAFRTASERLGESRRLASRTRLDQSGLDAVYNDLLHTKPECRPSWEGTGDKRMLEVVVTRTGEEGVLWIIDSVIPERAVRECDSWRALFNLRFAGDETFHIDTTKGIRTSGRYVIVEKYAPDGRTMKWLERHYVID